LCQRRQALEDLPDHVTIAGREQVGQILHRDAQPPDDGEGIVRIRRVPTLFQAVDHWRKRREGGPFVLLAFFPAS
jgi:hypothetical protein